MSIALRTNSAIELPVALLSASSRFIWRGSKLRFVRCNFITQVLHSYGVASNCVALWYGVVSQMKTFVESLSIGSGAILIALLSVGVVWLLSFVLPIALRWVSVAVVPFVLAYSIYWLPVWLGSDPSEYGAWAVLVVAPWFLSGFIPSAALVVILQKHRSQRVRKTRP